MVKTMDWELPLINSLKNISMYIINKGTYEILYVSDNLKQFFYDRGNGCTCYSFAGYEKICKNCPVLKETDEPIIDSVIHSEILHTDLNMTVVSILWRGVTPAYALIFSKITPFGAENGQIKFFDTYDRLTGIYNKEAFYKATRKLLFNNLTRDYFIILLNINNFKVINDLYGIEAGDELLRFIANKFAEIVKKTSDLPFSGTYGRIGSDVFAMCLIDEENKIDKVAHLIKESLDSYPLAIKISPSCGVFKIEDKDLPIEIMCDRADLALQSVKNKFIQLYAVYNDNMRNIILEEQEILNDMHTAIEENQFTIFLQPKYNMLLDSIIGAEALVRWNHPTKGMIPPYKFIPLFERNGFILKMDEYVWELACKTLRRWIDEGKTPLPISVNISRMHFYNPNLCNIFINLAEQYQIPPKLLELELTESAYTENPQQLYAVMEHLRSYGFVFSMDDFGSGYSSLNMLKDVAIDVLKIDLNFLRNSNQSERGQKILQATIRMAQSLDLPVIAEGVETREHVDFLLRSGCMFAQGYCFSKPVPIEEYEQKVSESQIKSRKAKKQEHL